MKPIYWILIAVILTGATLWFLFNRYLKNSYELSDLTNFGSTDENDKDMYYLSMNSLRRLNDVNPILIKIFKEAIKQSPIDFGIASGFRTLAEQKGLYALGRTKPGKIVTYADGIDVKSYHQSGNAVDIYAYVNGKASWDSKYYEPIARHIIRVAKDKFGVTLKWGGDWKKFKDLPHFQI